MAGIPTECSPRKDVGIPSTYCDFLSPVFIGEHIIENHSYRTLGLRHFFTKVKFGQHYDDKNRVQVILIKPTSCNSMQVFIYCKFTLHVSGVHRTYHQEHTTVNAASGTGHSNSATTFLQRGLIRTPNLGC